MLEFTREELSLLRRLKTPAKIQDFLEQIPINFEVGVETCMSPRRVLREHRAHCLEGALLSAAALWVNGDLPLVMNLKSSQRDVDHVVALFRRGGRWGALSKTNHAVLRYREPAYKTVRELVMSYFHEYFLDDGKKTMRSFSLPLNLNRFRHRGWMIDEHDLWYISDALDEQPHEEILTRGMIARLRTADPTEIRAGKIIQWKKMV